jgi:transcriptional regulator with XRE-family HTH domain
MGRIPGDTFAHRLLLARAMAGHLSIREAADLCEVGRGAWTNWERGSRPLDILNLALKIAQRLDVDEDWLLWGGPLDGARTHLRGMQSKSGILQLTDRPRDNRPSGRPDQRQSNSPPSGRPTVRRPRRIGDPQPIDQHDLAA